jgi:hypothetical protein
MGSIQELLLFRHHLIAFSDFGKSLRVQRSDRLREVPVVGLVAEIHGRPFVAAQHPGKHRVSVCQLLGKYCERSAKER